MHWHLTSNDAPWRRTPSWNGRRYRNTTGRSRQELHSWPNCKAPSWFGATTTETKKQKAEEAQIHGEGPVVEAAGQGAQEDMELHDLAHEKFLSTISSSEVCAQLAELSLPKGTAAIKTTFMRRSKGTMRWLVIIALTSTSFGISTAPSMNMSNMPKDDIDEHYMALQKVVLSLHSDRVHERTKFSSHARVGVCRALQCVWDDDRKGAPGKRNWPFLSKCCCKWLWIRMIKMKLKQHASVFGNGWVNRSSLGNMKPNTQHNLSCITQKRVNQKYVDFWAAILNFLKCWICWMFWGQLKRRLQKTIISQIQPADRNNFWIYVIICAEMLSISNSGEGHVE